MHVEQQTALAVFVFVSTFTPGPNNMMLMTSGVNIGFSKTLPHILGVTLGFGAMVFLVGIGATGIFTAFPILHELLKWSCLAYLIYLAVRIASSRPEISNDNYRPMTFFSAAIFQWVNPKGWSMALTAVTVYNPSANWQGLLWIATIFIIANIPSATTWVLAGKQISVLIKQPRHVRWFNYTMASLLIISTVPMVV